MLMSVKKLVDSADADENFFKEQRHQTSDETMKLKQPQSLHWVSKMSPKPQKKAHQVRSNVKVMLSVFFYFEGIIHHEFIPYCQTVYKDCYLKVKIRLREAVRRKGPDL